MIVFIGDGRLGNQMFQYSFINRFKLKDERIVTTNFSELIRLLSPKNGLHNITINRPFRRLIKYFRLLFQLFADAKLISSVRVRNSSIGDYSVECTGFTKVNGLLPLTYIYPCFVQSELFFLDYGLKLGDVDKTHLIAARTIINDMKFENKKSKCAFVHVRRGDYLDWSVFGMNPTLPLSYYKGCMDRILALDGDVNFIVLSDDVNFVVKNFSDYSNVYISKESQETDLCLMAMCQYGVLSSSSFSWWGGFMMTDRVKLFSPKYWLGWASKIEFPKGGAPSFAEEVEVESSQ